MAGRLERLGRVFARLWYPLAHIGRAARLIWLLTLLGVGAGLYLERVRAWIEGDWAHGTLVGLVILFGMAFGALYGLQGELDALKRVRLVRGIATAELRSILNYQTGPERDVLLVRLIGALRNEGERAANALFPTVSLLTRDGGRWVAMPLSYRELAARGAPRSSQSTLGPFWHQKKRFDVPSGEEIEFELWFHATSPSGATAFIGKG